eukprot:m.41980 g.41980  ORF g.41980 m.41980 type:complete len:135 (-) comp7033_c0_seq1:1836-2240(-)
MEEQQQQASVYLKEHRIPELIENMTAQLVYNRPADPRTFLREYVEKLERQRKGLGEKTDCPVFFDATNGKAVFQTFDRSQRGFITLDQYNTAMKSQFFSQYNEEPKGYIEGRITLDTFIEECSIASRASTNAFE